MYLIQALIASILATLICGVAYSIFLSPPDHFIGTSLVSVVTFLSIILYTSEVVGKRKKSKLFSSTNTVVATSKKPKATLSKPNAAKA
ncbi:MAG: hypothetical protein AAFU67_01090 [Bacteroidota bacterium]